jgi:hypothetical protein
MENKLKKNKIWVQNYVADEMSEAATADIALSLGLTRQTAQVLYNRGCRNATEAHAFLEQSAEKMHDPFLLKDVDRAVARIRQAIDNNERIAIYGDYDVDGVTAVSLLYLFLSQRGADVGSIICVISHSSPLGCRFHFDRFLHLPESVCGFICCARS